jgi:hypothetical protein
MAHRALFLFKIQHNFVVFFVFIDIIFWHENCITENLVQMQIYALS